MSARGRQAPFAPRYDARMSARADAPDSFRILLVGGGGREHALAWRLAQCASVERLFVTHPQNPGLAALGETADAPFDKGDTFRLERFCDKARVNLVVIGPEAPLAWGLADRLRTRERAVFGPGASGARLEADKAFAKRFMRACAIPTAPGRSFKSAGAACEYLRSREEPCVVKAAGLAAGKGVILPDTLDEALAAVNRIMVERAFGDAGDAVVIEERLKGVEASVFALIDGRSVYVLEPCQDHKRLLEGDRGPNTGGMGAYCPASAVDDETMSRIEQTILIPALDGLRREEIDYRGVLYVGLMLTPGGPKVLEFNVRFGDPECQTLLPRWKGDFALALWRAASGSLEQAEIDWDHRVCCCMTLASRGYPEQPEAGALIEGLDAAQAMDDVLVFHAGTRLNESGALATAGGRVLSVCALSATLDEARAKALAACDAIRFEGKQLRRDIGAGASALRPV